MQDAAAKRFDEILQVRYNESVVNQPVSKPLATKILGVGNNFSLALRRGDREADGAALEKRFPIFRDVGSNPTLSANRISYFSKNRITNWENSGSLSL